MSWRAPDPAPGGYIENGLTFLIDEEEGTVSYGVRLDVRSNLATLDEQVEPPASPEGGWPDGVVMVDARPVQPVARCNDTLVLRAPRAGRVERPRRGPSRERRGRSGRRTSGRRASASSRAGPSDEGEGDGEGPPSPVPSDVARERAHTPSSNSPSTDAVGPRWWVDSVGADTVVYGCRDSAAASALRELARLGTTGRAGVRYVWDRRHLRLASPVRGMVLGGYPSRGLITAEGRLMSMMVGHAAEHRLLSPCHLPVGADRAREALLAAGLEVAGPLVVCRCDLAADLRFADGADGLAFLSACERGLHLPRLKQGVEHAQGEARLESIFWHTPKGRKIHARLYDAGARHGAHRPGEWLRLEVELRWDGKRTPTPMHLAAADHARLFSERITPWLNAPKPIMVATPGGTIRRIYDAVRHGELELREANKLGARVNALQYGSDLLKPHDRRRKVRELRGAGFALDHSGATESPAIDLREPLAAMATAWAGKGGRSA